MDNQIRTAIAQRHMIEFSYHGLPRVAEPHLYGIQHGVPQVLTYQIEGLSESGEIPDWRRVNLDEVVGLKVLDRSFPGSRPNPSGRHSAFDYVYAVVN